MAKIKRVPAPTNYELLLNQDEVRAVTQALGRMAVDSHSNKSIGYAGRDLYNLLWPHAHPRKGTD